MKNEVKVLIAINDRLLAEEIQRFLEESEVFCMLVSDNPASSVLNAYMGSNPMENIEMHVNELDYQKAVDILSESPYKELINDA